MHIEELQLENFRGFAPLTIPFERHLTVLVGVNGAGKSSILDALATMFVLRLHSDALPSEPRDFTDRDVRVGCDDAQVTCRSRNAFGKDYYDWTRSFVGRVKAERKSRDSVGRTGMLKDSPETALVPVLAIYYPSRRSVIDTPERLWEPHSFEPVDALDLALEARVDFRLFFEWFHDRENLENERRAQESTSYRDPALSAVREAIVAFMPNVSEPRVQRAPRQRFVVNKDGSTLEIDQLSDGERTLLALVGDLARRLAMANPTDALKHEAVVMIDEVELHLHPGLQRDVVTGLRRTFPNVQFILTTHSPFVLGEVPARSIRLLRNFKLETPTIETKDEPIGTISRELQGTPERSREVDALLKKAHAACDAQDLPEAEKHLAALRERVGASDPDVIRLESLLDLLALGWSMRRIVKQREPAELIAHRNTQVGVDYDNAPKEPMRKALLAEQEGLCAYCMKQIDVGAMKIEHHTAQTVDATGALDWSNLLGVCEGGAKGPRTLQTCDTRKGNAALSLNPTYERIERQVTYNTNGALVASNASEQHEADVILGLNTADPRRARESTLDAFLNVVRAAVPEGT